MCGRFAIDAPRFSRIEKALEVDFADAAPRYNIAPTQDISVILRTSEPDQPPSYTMRLMRWGLIPHWSKGPSVKFSSFNARAESADKRPAFRDPFRTRRCLIPASGFYEWKKEGSAKRPYYFTDVGREGFAFAGLWDLWSGDGTDLHTCTILVGAPNELVSPVHDRMPIILPTQDYARWLDPAGQPDELRAMLNTFPAAKMRSWRVGNAVGNAKNDSADLIRAI